MADMNFPVHPRTGLSAIGMIDGHPVWPIKGGSEPSDLVVPPDLTLLSDDELNQLEADITAEHDRIRSEPNVTAETVERQLNLADDLDKVRVALTGRRAAAAAAAERAQAALVEQSERLARRVHGDPEQPQGGTAVPAGTFDPVAMAEAVAKATAEGTAAAIVAALETRNGVRLDPARVTERAQASLALARQSAPAPAAPNARKLAVTASVDVKGINRNGQLETLDDVVSAFQQTAKSMRDSAGAFREVNVVQIQREFDHTVDERTPIGKVTEVLDYLLSKDKQEALVAGGGWCAPSEIRYEFFNVAASDGLVDLPTVGISRGGVQVPVSPSLADAVYTIGGTANQNLGGFGAAFSNTSDPWLWTELDDRLTVTGSVNKPTMRVPCPSFTETRLECWGITLTAGNLTDDAYPEATANTLRLLMAAWEHAQNGRILSQMVALCTSPAITGGGFVGTNKPVFNQVLSGLDLACTDYRAKYGMRDADVLEVVAPFWVKDVITADLAWRGANSTELLSITDAQIDGFFADRNVRVQWVNDWQVRGTSQFGNATTPMTAWPITADFMVYAAGTFLKGNGLTLDLGVVRDSVLNAENDFTAAWSEECHLVAKVGHEARRYSIGFAVNGTVGAGIAAGAQI